MFYPRGYRGLGSVGLPEPEGGNEDSTDLNLPEGPESSPGAEIESTPNLNTTTTQSPRSP